MVMISSSWFLLVGAVAVGVILQTCLVESQQVPAIFVFGDSLVDVGNSNFLNSDDKANYYPYGCDSTAGSVPSGRFSNGKNFADMLGDLLHVPSPPAFADPSTVGDQVLRGVNYASADAGILDETSQDRGDRYPLSQQVQNFETTLDQIRAKMGGRDIDYYLSKSIAIIVIGTNDYTNNYLLHSKHTPSEFANLLLSQYSRQVQALHSLGLRKFFLAGLGPIGCLPVRRATGVAPPGRCVDGDNEIVGHFNEGMRSLVTQLNDYNPGAHFVYGNSYGAFGDMLNNPGKFGLSVIDKGCCEVDVREGKFTCSTFSYPCSSRSQYLFWDAFNPTEVANAIVARRVFSGPIEDCYPVNVQQLALF